MKKYLYSVLFSFALISFSNSVHADDHMQSGPGAIEILSCKYNEGKSSKDLAKVVKEWNKWQDKQDGDYQSWTMEPYAFDPSQYPLDVDFFWFGLSSNWKNFGKDMQAWLDEGISTHGENFDSVAPCSSRALFSAIPIRNFDFEVKKGQSNPFQISNCKIKEGKSFQDLLKVASEFNKVLDGNGDNAGIIAMIPDAGNPANPDWDFKLGVGWSDYNNFGNSRSNWYSGTSEEAAKTYGAVVDCDSPRIYSTTQQRY